MFIGIQLILPNFPSCFSVDEAEADAEAVARAFKNMPDELKELVASNMDKVPKNGQVS